MILTDESPMPWGKHKGTPMKDVPASYLLFMYDSQLLNKGAVMNYVIDNMQALLKEVKDNPLYN